MDAPATDANVATLAVLGQLTTALRDVQQNVQSLMSAVEAINSRANVFRGIEKIQDVTPEESKLEIKQPSVALETPSGPGVVAPSSAEPATDGVSVRRGSAVSRIVLTTYPGQSGVNPLPMNWGHADPWKRGPVVVSRNDASIRRRNGELFYRIQL